MAITFPRNDIVNGLMIQSQTPPTLTMRQEMSRAASGRVYGKDLGPAIWQFSWTTKPLRRNDALAFEARLHSLRGVIGTFYGWDLRRTNPKSDPTGATLNVGPMTVTYPGYPGSYSVVLPADANALMWNMTANTLALEGLPPYFILNEGDYCAVLYSNGTKRSYHRLLETAAADQWGVVPLITVQPEFRPGTVAIGSAVILKNARALCSLKFDGIQLQEVDQLHSTISFSAVEA